MIPSNLQECNIELDKILIKEDKEFIKLANLIDLHANLGRRIRNDWGLLYKNKLSDYFNNLGIWHPNDISSIILTFYKCYLNNTFFNLNNEIEKYKQYWRANSENS